MGSEPSLGPYSDAAGFYFRFLLLCLSIFRSPITHPALGNIEPNNKLNVLLRRIFSLSVGTVYWVTCADPLPLEVLMV